MILLTILIFIIILGLLVFVHELGHFIVAKRAGMQVEEFGFGFPPRLFGIKKGETTYSINLIPLGGFVKILGEDGTDADNPKSFGHKSFGRRFAVLLAGVSMNVVLACVLISIGFALGLPTVIEQGQSLPHNAKIRDVAVSVLDVNPNSPANQAGIRIGDQIVKINNIQITSINQAQDLTQQDAGKLTVYTLKRGNLNLERSIVPRANPPQGQGPLGIALSSVGLVSYPWYQAIPRGFAGALTLLWATIVAFITILGHFFTGQKVGIALSGPVGIAVLTRDVAQLGFIYVLQFTAILSVNLAVINAVPFPALDGGRVLFLIIEKIKGRKMQARAEQIANTIGFVFLMLLMVVVTVKDVTRFSDKFFNLFQRIKEII